MTKYLIFGNGYMGNKFHAFLADSVLSKKRINSVEDVESEIKKHDPRIVINCIGRTGTPNVDWCESHIEETMHSNIIVPIYILMACEQLSVRMVHLSSGCIYTGDNNGQGFAETDEPNFYGSVYSWTKIFSEKMLKDFNVLQLRIRIPMDGYPHPKNIITKLLGFDKIIDVENSLTYVPELLRTAKLLMNKKCTGVFNVVCKGSITHPKLLDLYNEVSPIEHKYGLMDVSELKRRSNCALSVAKLESLGIEVMPIQDAVRKAVSGYEKKKIRKIQIDGLKTCATNEPVY